MNKIKEVMHKWVNIYPGAGEVLGLQVLGLHVAVQALHTLKAWGGEITFKNTYLRTLSV